jgi:ribose transport system substrate-binding protein
MAKRSACLPLATFGGVLGAALFAATATPVMAKPLDMIGITVGSLGNPYFVALGKGITAEAKKANPKVRVVSVSSDYDLNKQFTQIDNFISSGASLIVINAADSNAILPAIKRAQQAGVAVVAADVAANGADATVMTDNVAAGRISCTALVQDIGGKGNVIIENGPQVSSVFDRVKGCKEALAKAPGIKIVSDDQDGKASRDGGLAVTQGYLVRFPEIAAIFTINDPEAIGTELAIKQAHRGGIVVTSVDGAPDIVGPIQQGDIVKASASQDPYTMGEIAVRVGEKILSGQKPDQPTILMAPKLVTKETVGGYVGWTQH